LQRRKRVSVAFAAVGFWAALAGCDRRPVELGFWFEPVAFASPRLGGPITNDELSTIDAVARAEIQRAFEAYAITLTDNRRARLAIAVVPTLTDRRHRRRQATHAGEARAIAGFGGAGFVNFEYVANGATVFAPDDATRADLVAAIGRGVGRVAIHEFLHLLLPKAAIDESADPASYEGNTAARLEGYYGHLHWGSAAPLLNARLQRR
jgi:hypothetical protein